VLSQQLRFARLGALYDLSRQQTCQTIAPHEGFAGDFVLVLKQQPPLPSAR
jgi:hypothetical protein